MGLVMGGTALFAGAGALVYSYLFGDYRTYKKFEPDSSISPKNIRTGYTLVNALVPKLQDIASQNDIPLGLMIAWIAKESGGRLTSHTSLDERGYYQLMPEESKALGLDHQRLSTDSDYSLDAGTKMIKKYAANADKMLRELSISVPRGSPFYWLIVKMIHTVGAGQTRKWLRAANAAGAAGSWDAFAEYVQGQRWTGPQPKKWIPFLATIYKLGAPFGFGSGAALVAGFYDPRGALPPFDDSKYSNELIARCPYCVDGYHEYCDAKDGLGAGACSCDCAQSGCVDGLEGLDYLVVF